MIDCKNEVVNMGYSSNEPSINYLAYFYYRKYFCEIVARIKADEYCDKLTKAMEGE